MRPPIFVHGITHYNEFACFLRENDNDVAYCVRKETESELILYAKSLYHYHKLQAVLHNERREKTNAALFGGN